MGLIKATFGSIGSTMADQWKEFFVCDSLPANVLVRKGQKKTGKRSSNTKGSDNHISNGSGVVVADGQCMIIVEQGKVVEICAEPGEYTYDTSLAPSIFTGGLGGGIADTFREIGRRFGYGGDAARDQRVYYFNTKEILDNKFGTPTPIPFRVVDSKIGLDIDMSLRCNGVYSYRITNPILFYTNVCSNVSDEYLRSDIDSQLKTEFVSALMPAVGRMSALELRPNQIMNHTRELCDYMNEELTSDWSELRGISVVSIALNPITLTDEDAELLRQAQHAGMLRNPAMAAGTLASAQAQAMRDAANNQNGAAMAFMGMGMAQNAGGANIGSLYAMGDTAPAQREAKDSWRCACGTENTGKFCSECGAKRPQEQGWVCSCGAENTGKFCSECGAKKPQGAFCSECGHKFEGALPKFCPECGNKL